MPLLACPNFFKKSLPLPTVIVHKPANYQMIFAGLSTFDLATGTRWKDFLKVVVCFKMIVMKCVCLLVSKFSICFHVVSFAHQGFSVMLSRETVRLVLLCVSMHLLPLLLHL